MIEEFLCLTKFILQKKREKKKSQFFNFSDLFLFDLLFFRFLSIDRIFEAIFSLIFCYSKKRFMRRRVFLWALNLILDSIQFRCHCTSQLTSHQMMSKEPKKKPKLSSQKQIWYSRPINYAFPKRSSQKIMEWILKDLLCFIRSFEIQLKSCHVSK